LESSIKRIFREIESVSEFEIENMETDQDHIHLLVNSLPMLSPFSIVNRLKSISTNRIWKLYHGYLSKHFWKEHTFWSDGYFVCSIGNACIETIRNYIDSQG
jgi:putative transposase